MGSPLVSTARRSASALATVLVLAALPLAAASRHAPDAPAAVSGESPDAASGKSPAAASAGARSAIVGRIGGPVVAAAAYGGHAYAGLGTTVVVLDAADRLRPHPTGTVIPVPCTVTDVAVERDRLYVAFRSGFRAYGLADPAGPSVMGEWRESTECHVGGAGRLAPAGDHLYATGIGWGTGAVDKVFDVRDPAAIRLVGEFDHGPKAGIALGGGRLYAAEGRSLLAYDIGRPESPVEVARLDLGDEDGYAQGVAYADGRVLLATGGGLVVTAADLSAPRRMPTGALVRDVVARGDRAFLAAGAGGGVWAVDLTHPSGPHPMGSAPVGDARRVHLAGDVVLVSSAGDGLWSVDVSGLPSLEARQVLPTWSGARDVEVSGHVAVVSSAGGIVTVDVSDPAAPRTLDVERVLGEASQVAVDGRTAYVLGERSGPPGTLTAFDLADPADLRSTGVATLDGGAMALAAGGGRAYVSDSMVGLRIFDGDGPSGPVEIGRLSTTPTTRLALRGDHLYGVAERFGLRVMDVSDPSSPRFVTTFDVLTRGLGGLAAAGRRVYVTSAAVAPGPGPFGEEPEDLVEIDASDPAAPVLGREIGLVVDAEPAFPRDIAVAGGRAYVASGTFDWRFGANGFGLFAAQVDDPEPVPDVWRIPMPDQALGVAALDGLVLVAARDAGLLIVDPDVRPTPAPTATFPPPTPEGTWVPTPTATGTGAQTPTATSAATQPTRAPTTPGPSPGTTEGPTEPPPTPTTHWHYDFVGVVYDGTGGGRSPLAGAVVEVDACYGGAALSDPTGPDGRYRIDSFTSGSFGCGRTGYVVMADGYETVRLEAGEPPHYGVWNEVRRDFDLLRPGGRLFLPRALVAAPPTAPAGAAPRGAPPGQDPAAAPAADGPTVAGCPLLPADHVWNTRVDGLPVDPRSADYVTAIGRDNAVHPDFGAGDWNGAPIGIPFVVVPGTQPRVPVSFEYADESDPGPYPVPTDAPIEGGPSSTGDRHVLVVDRDECRLYELYAAHPDRDGSWRAGSGAVFDLASNALRPAGWTSADAAGLPILPGLVRYEEIAAGEIRHALRVTAPRTRRAYVWPGRHFASSLTELHYPPMGQRFRLRADFALGGFSPDVRVLLQAFKTYGLMLADNGSPWFITGVPDERWDNQTLLDELRRVRGSDFEAVDSSSLVVHADSGQARPAQTGVPSPTSTRPVDTPSPPTPGTTAESPTAAATPEASATRAPTRPAVTDEPPHAWLPLALRHARLSALATPAPPDPARPTGTAVGPTRTSAPPPDTAVPSPATPATPPAATPSAATPATAAPTSDAPTSRPRAATPPATAARRGRSRRSPGRPGRPPRERRYASRQGRTPAASGSRT